MSHATFLTITEATPQVEAVLWRIQGELHAIEELLEKEIADSPASVAEIGDQLLQAGGKRLRPALLALSANVIGPDYPRERIVVHGAAMELVHMATLVHDDVIDETSSRRGKPTANALHGNTASVLAGDSLLARAMRLLADDGDMGLIRVVTKMVVAMSEGATLEALGRGRLDLSEAEYLEIIGKKTAVFVAGCCRVGAILAGADEATAKQMEAYGYHLGVAFQVVDDLLDYLGDPQKTGKAVGTDYREGNATLPLIRAIGNASPEAVTDIVRGFANNRQSECLAIVARLIRATNSDAYANEVAERHAFAALDHITSLPESAARECLEKLARFVVARES